MYAQGVVIGERVTVVVRGAQVEALYPTAASVGGAHLDVVLRHGPNRFTLDVQAAGVDVQRVAPATWPPADGDVWSDRHGVGSFIGFPPWP